jgi:uncharacterized protein (TIGR03083 family)
MPELDVTAAERTITREWGGFVDRLRALDGPGWDRPTRLTGWSVRDLVAHTVWGTSMEADALRRWRTGETDPADGRTVDAATAPAELLAEITSSTGALGAELARVVNGDPGRPVPMPYGEMPVALVLQVFVMEAGVHASDLAAAVGDENRLEPDVVTATVPVLAAFLPVFGGAAEEKPAEGTVVALDAPSIDLRLRFTDGAWSVDRGDSPAEVISGDDSTLTLFALGRVPATSVRGPAPARDAFKAWFPGP